MTVAGDRAAAARAESNINAPREGVPAHLRSGPIGRRHLTVAERTMGNTAADVRARIDQYNELHGH